MGWCGNYKHYASKFEALVSIEGLDPAKVVAHSTYGREVYVAYQYDGESIGCLVGLVEKHRDGATMVKGMDETMQPCYYNPSAKVLSALTPTQDEGALLWRQACEGRRAAKRNRRSTKPSLTLGQAVRAIKDIPFGAYTVSSGDTATFVREIPRAKYRLVFQYRGHTFRLSNKQFNQYLTLASI